MENCGWQKTSDINPGEVAKKACPRGWHLPTDEEWKGMMSHYGGIGKEAYEALISGGSTHFDATLSGFKKPDDYSFFYLQRRGYYWNSSEVNYDSETSGLAYEFYGTFRRQIYPSSFSKDDGLSVRCIQD